MKPDISMQILKNGNVIADTIGEGKLFWLATSASGTTAMAAKAIPVEEITVWHQRMAHL